MSGKWPAKSITITPNDSKKKAKPSNDRATSITSTPNDSKKKHKLSKDIWKWFLTGPWKL